jgi:hypothetical protein
MMPDEPVCERCSIRQPAGDYQAGTIVQCGWCGERLEMFTTLMEALATRAELAPDQEIADDALAEGINLKAEAERIRNLLLDAMARAMAERSPEEGEG